MINSNYNPLYSTSNKIDGLSYNFDYTEEVELKTIAIGNREFVLPHPVRVPNCLCLNSQQLLIFITCKLLNLREIITDEDTLE